jgi:hypothetical protein
METFVIQVTVSDGKLQTTKTSDIFIFDDLNSEKPGTNPDGTNPDGTNPDGDGGNTGGGMSCNMGTYLIYAFLPLGLLPILKKRK